jgi:hypothetical protein
MRPWSTNLARRRAATRRPARLRARPGGRAGGRYALFKLAGCVLAVAGGGAGAALALHRVVIFVAIVGPGLIVMVGDNNAGGVATYAQTGRTTPTPCCGCCRSSRC